METYRVTRLYPQYQRSQDRRQRNIPVAVDRRSGQDRRSEDRVVLDKQLTRDIFEIKSKVAKLEELAPKLFEANVTRQAPTFTSMNNMTQDILVKESKPDMNAQLRQESEKQDDVSTMFKVGVLAAALGVSAFLSLFSSAGVVILLGTGLYIGGRILKTVLVDELKDDDKKDN